MSAALPELWLALLRSLVFCGKLALFLVPVMVALEFLKDTALLRPRQGRLTRALARFGFSPASSLALFTGLALGIIYGAGVLIGLQREHKIPAREMTSVAVFLCLCHAMVEDPMIFVLIGGGWPLMVLPRLALALLVTFLMEEHRRAASRA